VSVHFIGVAHDDIIETTVYLIIVTADSIGFVRNNICVSHNMLLIALKYKIVTSTYNIILPLNLIGASFSAVSLARNDIV
jgi:hypothetical protein